MAKQESTIDILLDLPWWVSVVLAGVVYFFLKYWLPSIQFENPIFKGMASGLPGLAGLFAGLLLLIALVSAVKSVGGGGRRRTRAKNDSAVDALSGFPWWLNVVLAGVVWVIFRYWLPSIRCENPIPKGLSSMFPGMAILLAVVFLVAAVVSAVEAWRKGMLLESQRGLSTLRELSWREFEELVGEAYRRRGYSVAETGGGGADGGVDLVLTRGGERLLVQCKHWKAWKVNVKVVRELFGVVSSERATGGILISSGTYTKDAREFASENGIELVDGPGLLGLVAEVQREPRVEVSALEPVRCPLCGAEMVLRTARKGANAGNKFWGCSAYPGCRGTRPYGG